MFPIPDYYNEFKDANPEKQSNRGRESVRFPPRFFYFMVSRRSKLATAPKPRTPAAIAKPVSRGPVFFRLAAGAGRGAAVATGAGLVTAAGAAAATAAGRAILATGAAAAGGLGGGGAPVGMAGFGAAAPGVVAAAPGGFPPAGRVGRRMVAVEAGLGGKLMRTVSFLGCTLGASAGFGGRPPEGEFGFSSAIKQYN